MEEVKVEKQKRGFMDWYFKSNLLLRILFGLVLGAIVGLIVGPKIAVIKPFGDLLIRLLQMIVVPVVFFSLITGSASISPARLGRVGVKIIVYYLSLIHISEPTRLGMISYAVFCLKKKKT